VSRVGTIAILLVVLATAVLAVFAYFDLKGATDAQAGLVIPFILFWGALALVAVAFVDFVIRTLWRAIRDFRSEPPEP
jgi:Kef-type K+ transport system membrane component KefB